MACFYFFLSIKDTFLPLIAFLSVTFCLIVFSWQFFLIVVLLHRWWLLQWLRWWLLSLLSLIGIPDLHIQLSIRSPAFDTKNSPVMTPTNDNPIFTFSELKNVPILAGITILVSIWSLLALNVFAILMSSLSVFRKPFNISSMVTMSDIASPMVMMAPHACSYPYDDDWSGVLLLASCLVLLKMALILLLKSLTTIAW